MSLTHEGLQLAAACLLELLQKFEGRQIATYGTTAIPLLTACVMQSQGRYEGFLVRKERKPHGSLKLIEGRANPNEPVILIDDSVSSGISMQKCRDILEAEGFRVEGGVCLVRFDWYGGFALMQEQGYHMEALFDVDQDIVGLMEDEEKLILNPTKQYLGMPVPWSDVSASEGLSPTALAREVIETYLCSGKLLRPPEVLDQTYQHQGGCYISIRDRHNINLRYARDGFWHFPGEPAFSAAKDVVLASWQTARYLPQGREGMKLLSGSGIAVTLFSALEVCQVGDLDNERYGIVVRSKERPTKMGGALPRMPGIATSGQQFQYAYKSNAGLVSFEPHTLYRHDVYKIVEPDVAWQASGVGYSNPQPRWFESATVAHAITQRAWAYVNAAVTGKAVQGDALPAGLCPALDTLYLTIYRHRHLVGCMGKEVHDLDQDLQVLAEAALQDGRFGHDGDAQTLDGLTLKVSLLHSPLELGAYEPDEVMTPVRFGEQALLVHQGEKDAILLPDFPVTANYSEKAYVAALLEKAGITQAPYAWRRYECSTWLDDGENLHHLVKGFPLQSNADRDMVNRLPLLRRWWMQYIQRQQRQGGAMDFYYLPFAHQLDGTQDNVRAAHAAWMLTRAQGAGLEGLDSEKLDTLFVYLQGFVCTEGGRYCLAETGQASEHKYDSLAGTALWLMAWCARGKAVSPADAALAAGLAETLWCAFDRHGRIENYLFPDPSYPQDAYQDYIPGQVLLALALACHAGFTSCDTEKLDKALAYYWHRFCYKRRADQVGWLVQAWFAWWQVNRREALLEQLVGMVDWILQFQSKREGGFTTWQQQDGRADYLTAVYLEAVAAAAQAMQRSGDLRRYQAYREACLQGFAFLDSLTLQQRDQPILPDVVWAEGGIRQNPVSSSVRVDFSQHALSAALYAMGA